jgi:hypothetical protein
MGILSLLLLLAADDPVENLAKKLLPIYIREAAEYSIAVEPAPEKPLELKREPVFEWSNPARQGLQQGVLFLWLRDGRPAALGCIFSEPAGGLPGRWVMHELHALDAEKLLVNRPGALNEWKPQAGLERKELPGAGAPAGDRGARLLQMRRLAQEFAGHSVDKSGKRWELRLLPAPLFRYPAAPAGVIDGALFTLVSSAGTDPEVLLLLEVKEAGGKLRWQYACGRFSDWELRVQRRGKEVFSSVPGGDNPFAHDPLHLYRIYPDKIVSLEGKLLARVRQTSNGPGGQTIPVNEK